MRHLGRKPPQSLVDNYLKSFENWAHNRTDVARSLVDIAFYDLTNWARLANRRKVQRRNSHRKLSHDDRRSYCDRRSH